MNALLITRPRCAAVLLGALAFLAACGGGDVADDATHMPPPATPDCQARPEVCR